MTDDREFDDNYDIIVQRKDSANLTHIESEFIIKLFKDQELKHNDKTTKLIPLEF